MPFWRIFFHIVWATKNRQPFITDEIEAALYPILASKCKEKEARAFAINGMPEHVHLIVSTPPKLSPAELIGHVKGASSFAIQARFDTPFGWQRGYGVLSISTKSVRRAIDYVRNQKAHHANGTLYEALERTSDEDDGPTLIPPLPYE